MKRFSDILFSLFGLLIIAIPILVIAICIKLDSKGPIFFLQKRVGKNGKLFNIIKFRTMYVDHGKNLQLTIGNRDPRITKVGLFLRKYKIDELPQLINVLKGDMSMVGPRPEVPNYVTYYTEADKEILKIKPGITDWASIEFINENEILAKSKNPEYDYINIIMPQKIELNMHYLKNYSLKNYYNIIYQTLRSMF